MTLGCGLVALAVVLWIAFRMGQASERFKRAPGPSELGDELQRAAARGEWRTP